MTNEQIIRAWKDPDYRDDNTDHPSGEIAVEHVGGLENFSKLSEFMASQATQCMTCYPLLCAVSLTTCRCQGDSLC